jgi:glycine dehydrogenase subunit 1
MDISNASMYDGSTAAAEAVSMAKRITKRSRVVLSNTIHPHYADVIKTVSGVDNNDFIYNRSFSINIDNLFNDVDDNTACVVVQNPDFFGSCYDLSELSEFVQSKGALLIVVVTEVLSLGMMKSPGSMGADIVACEGQSLGNPLNFGGPYVGLLSTKDKYLRQIPGRIVGESEDVDGKKGFVLTLSAREQHIRREKATSNICTNSGLCSLAFTIHLTLLGEKGFKGLSRLNHQSALNLREKILKISNIEILNTSFFNEFTLSLPINGETFIERMAEKRVLAGIPVSRLIKSIIKQII